MRRSKNICVIAYAAARLFGDASVGFGDTVVAFDCSQLEVQKAVDSAKSGDIVRLPEGSATWSSRVHVSDKEVHVVGAGIGRTSITYDMPVSFGNACFWFSSSASTACSISGITFVGSSDAQYGCVCISGAWEGFRVYNCHFDNILRRGLAVRGRAIGLIDSCT